jgi:tripartite-type tricarboxylate transporter receptor subunit TctC
MPELGYDVVFEDWSGIIAPARTPRDIVARANAAISEVVRSPATATTLAGMGVDVNSTSPDEFAALYRSTWERYREVVKSTGFTAED